MVGENTSSLSKIETEKKYIYTTQMWAQKTFPGQENNAQYTYMCGKKAELALEFPTFFPETIITKFHSLNP